MPSADLVLLHDRTWQRIDVAVGRIERLGLKLAAERDEISARLAAAAMFARHAITAAIEALDAYDHTQPHAVHDGVVECLAHLRTLESVLTGTPPKTETPTPGKTTSRSLVRKHFN